MNTVCENALCPNCTECYGAQTATFMILGNVCTRNCAFCHVTTGQGQELELREPERVAAAAFELGLEYVVVTSVTRDDLADEGAGQFARTIRALKDRMPYAGIEVLVPDFHAREELIAQVMQAGPDVYNHNMETVRRLHPDIRPQASYETSLEALRTAKKLNAGVMTKSGWMVGLGERDSEMEELARDLRGVSCDIVTVGQYLAPSPNHWKVEAYYEPEQFSRLRERLIGMGFPAAVAGPYVRSSYQAKQSFLLSQIKSRNP